MQMIFHFSNTRNRPGNFGLHIRHNRQAKGRDAQPPRANLVSAQHISGVPVDQA